MPRDTHADPAHVAILRQGSKAWNTWRGENPEVEPNLGWIDFEKDVWQSKHTYDLPHFETCDFSGAFMQGITARNSYFHACNFDEARLSFSDLCFSGFDGCSFAGAEMRVTRIGSAHFNGCRFTNADLAYCSAEETDFAGSEFVDCGLGHMSLVRSDFTDATLNRVFVYGTSAWDLTLTGTVQRDVFLDEDTSLRVDDIEIAQFIHLLVRNTKLRSVLDSITSKVVLLLGRFSEERKPVLEELRRGLGDLGYVPVIFDFEKPSTRDLTETVATLAHMARFVVADLSDPRSVPHELATIVPGLPSVPVQPIIETGQNPFGMFEHWNRYPWVLEPLPYSVASLPSLPKTIASRCEELAPKRG